MQFTRQDDFYRVSRVTGPTHNFLSVALTIGAEVTPQAEALPGHCHAHRALDPLAILSHAQEGLALANQQFGTDYRLSHAQYCVGDSPPEAVYGVLVFKIIEHLTSGGEFPAPG